MKPKLEGFYVYVDKRPNGVVFYVGKGSGSRLYQNKGMRSSNKYWVRVVLKDKSFTREVIKAGLSERQAFDLEKELILKHSKTIVNATGGGEGNKLSAATRAKISKALMGNKNGRFKIMSDAEKKRVGDWARTRVRSKEERNKMAKAKLGKPSNRRMYDKES